MQISEWVIKRLEPVSDAPRVLVRDSLRLLPEVDSRVHEFALEHGFTVIVAATNLVFRELYDQALSDVAARKLLVIDRAPARRRRMGNPSQAPAPFYPDLLAMTPEEARVELDLWQMLCDVTHDPRWPQQATNDPRYARLIVRNLDGVVQAHRNLRRAHSDRFTDEDFQHLVSFAALGVPESAFKKLGAKDYWKIGLIGHEALRELESLAPEVTATVKKDLQSAPAPFCWLATHDPETVIRAFYLSALLSQHLENWRLVLAGIDPALAHLSDISPDTLKEAAPQLVALDPRQAESDLEFIERSLDSKTLQTLLVDHLHVNVPEGFAGILERERYSTLLRCLALLAAIDNLLGPTDEAEQRRVAQAIDPGRGGPDARSFAEQRRSTVWDQLTRTYTLAAQVRDLREDLAAAVREIRVMPQDELTFEYFWQIWNDRHLNRFEYTVSALKRLLDTAELLPRGEAELPTYFGKTVQGLQKRARAIYDEMYLQLDQLNERFQEVVARQYPTWLAQDTDVRLTSQFVRRSLKPHWEPAKEKAVVLVFDGMRYDIWEELLRPLLEDRMEIIESVMASSLLPSETHVSRWALAAGTQPKDYLFPHRAESVFLDAALKRDLGIKEGVKIWSDGAGIGETVRYRAGNLDYYIFEFCDKELHKIQMKELPGGRMEPARPLALIYQQLESFVENEVMAIVRKLGPGTKVFVTADHGFGPIGGKPIWFDRHDLNEDDDCSYRNCWLRVPFDQAQLPAQARANVLAFTLDQLGLPKRIPYQDKASGQTAYNDYKAIVFPKVGYAFSRNGSKFRPAAYSHGGISVQELMIPMVVLRVRPQEEGLLVLDQITGPAQPIEGEKMEFRMPIRPANLFSLSGEDLRVNVEASYSREPEIHSLAPQVLYVGTQGTTVIYRFRADRSDATEEELREGRMQRTLVIGVSYPEGTRMRRKTQTFSFIVQLNTDRIARRVPTNLDNILGLMPKNAK